MSVKGSEISFVEFKTEVIADYKIACISRSVSIQAIKELNNSNAKYGILGVGNEVVQIAMAKQFKKVDNYSGLSDKLTFMLATGMITPKDFFTELLLSDTESNVSEGFMTQPDGLTMASDIDCIIPDINESEQYYNNANEVVFCATDSLNTARGSFFETINTASVSQIPMALSVWDAKCGKKAQITKGSISKALKGFEKGPKDKTGILIYKGKGWDYPGLCQIYEEGVKRCRKEHVPVLFHIKELTQPILIGPHEGFRSEKCINWEKEHDCIIQMRKWMFDSGLAFNEELDKIEKEAVAEVEAANKEVNKRS